jgi:hypothetical protein
MAINHTNVNIPIHGGLFHSTCIFIATYICNERKYKLKNTEIFSSMYGCPGIPDIYIEYEYKGKDDNGKTRTLKNSVCIEIETNMTDSMNIQKCQQFTRPGMREPIIIDVGKGLDEFERKQKEKGKIYENQIDLIYAYIDWRIVL